VVDFRGLRDLRALAPVCFDATHSVQRPSAGDGVTGGDRTLAPVLARAAAALRPGARLVYATCSLLPEENTDRVAALLTAQPELELVRSAEILGSAVAAPITGPDGAVLSVRPDLQGCDGFFAAVLRRRRAGRV
jgi:16S rRNA (cytosine967-C5)-methyltransferase